jgi:hypothetical protein
MLTSVLTLTCASAVLAQGFLQLDLEHGQGPRLKKRQTSTSDLSQEAYLGQNGSLYWLNITIGTPPQSLRLQLDTGSSDVVVTNGDVPQCSAPGGCPSGKFFPKDSSTYEDVGTGFDNPYGDGTEYIGDFFTDVVNVGGIAINSGDLIMGIANELKDGPNLVNDGSGLIGVGYQALSGVTVANSTLPPTVISAMVASGDIGRQAYSIYLGSQESGKGQIIFGGVDSSLYTGDLVALPILQTQQNGTATYMYSNVALTGISITDDSGTRALTDSSFQASVLLDSGNTLTDLPSNVFDEIAKGFGVTESRKSCLHPLPYPSHNRQVH